MVPKMASRETEYLDATWLLGDEPTSRTSRSGLWFGTVLCLGLAAAVMWTWPYLSRWYLQREYVQTLLTQTDPHARIESLTALSQFLPESVPDLLIGFAQDDATAEYTYLLLQRYLEQLDEKQTDSKLAHHQHLMVSLERAHLQFTPEGLGFAMRITEDLKHRYQGQQDRLGKLMEERTSRFLAQMVGESVRSGKFVAPTTLEPVVASDRASLAHTISNQDNRQPLSSDSSALPPQESVPEPIRPEPKQSLSFAKPPLEERAAKPVIVRGGGMKVLRVLDTTESKESNYEPEPMQPKSSVVVGSSYETEASSNDDSIVQSIAAMEKLPTGDVLRLLANPHTRIVSAALANLERRGFDQARLDVAVELAQGTTEQKMASMERLIRSGAQPIPWLLWMAEDGDRDVRWYAVNQLASFADPNVYSELRLLWNRENDKQIRDQLQRILVSTGSPTERVLR